MIYSRPPVAAAGLTILSLAAGASAVRVQDPATHEIQQADAVAPKQLSLIRGLRELADGRVIVTDWIEERIVLVNFESGHARAVSNSRLAPRVLLTAVRR